nr:hypothetical protein [uncultured organism]
MRDNSMFCNSRSGYVTAIDRSRALNIVGHKTRTRLRQNLDSVTTALG